MELDEGYIKYNLKWIEAPPLDHEFLKEMIHYRNRCFQKGFIGVYPDTGIGYGNISARFNARNQFVISGTQTGHLTEITADHFTMVTHVDFKHNAVACSGPVKASAESLTHAMFYHIDPQINCVIHIHQPSLWKELLFKAPTTPADIPYGTTDMCGAVEYLYLNSTLPEEKIVVMAGHPDGIISFGENFQEAYETLVNA